MARTAATSETDLRAALSQYRQDNPGKHLRDAARALGVTEAELLVATDAEVIRLDDARWAELFQALPSLGRVKTMTRNEEFVIEKTGVYEGVGIFGQVGQTVGPDLDLRIFFARWCAAFAVRQPAAEGSTRGDRLSIQIFDRVGSSVHKCFVQTEEGAAAFDALVEEFRAAEQPGSLEVTPFPIPTLRPDEEVDTEALRREWDAMHDTHDFFGLLGRHRVRRTQALRLAGPERAERIAADCLEGLLDRVVEAELPIMIFVGNPGMIQIYSGPIKKVVRTQGWLNILDPGFNLHARDDQVTECWVVRKPTPEGIVTALELYNEAGEDVALLFSVRREGEEECAEWRDLLAALPRETD